MVYVPKSHCRIMGMHAAAVWAVCPPALPGPVGERGKNEEGRRAIATVAGADAGVHGAGAVAGEGMPWIGEAATVP